MKRLRVIRVYKNLKAGGGVQTRLMELLPRLAEHVDVRMLCYRGRGDRADELETAGVPVDVIPMGSKWAPWNVARYVAYFRRHRPDVVHTHEYTANTLVIHAAARAGVPVRVRHLHSMAPWGWGGPVRTRLRVSSDRRAALRARTTLAVSHAVRRVFLDATGLPVDACRVLYNGISLEPFVAALEKGEAFRAEMGIHPGVPVAGILGRLSRGKGHDLFLRAACEIVRVVPDARFLVVGDGGRRPHLESLAAELGLGDRVVFAGHRGDVAAALGAMDVFLFTSGAERDGRVQDGLPGVVIESLAAGTPVVAFSLPMMTEIFDGTACGALVEPGDVAGLAREAVAFLSDPARRNRAAERGVARARAFGLGACVDATLDLYRELVAPTAGGCGCGKGGLC